MVIGVILTKMLIIKKEIGINFFYAEILFGINCLFTFQTQISRLQSRRFVNKSKPCRLLVTRSIASVRSCELVYCKGVGYIEKKYIC